MGFNSAPQAPSPESSKEEGFTEVDIVKINKFGEQAKEAMSSASLANANGIITKAMKRTINFPSLLTLNNH